jgi:hypothetical protein
MRLPLRASHVPLRLATGAFVLDSGLGKRAADEQTAAGLHGMATGAYPPLGGIEPARFVRLLSAGEIALGAALLTPVVPSLLAGAGLTAFGAGLVGLYARTPGMRRPGSVFPSPDGLGLAKDVWMVGAGLALVLDGLADRRR